MKQHWAKQQLGGTKTTRSRTNQDSITSTHAFAGKDSGPKTDPSHPATNGLQVLGMAGSRSPPLRPPMATSCQLRAVLQAPFQWRPPK
jgi:hypothetical protein